MKPKTELDQLHAALSPALPNTPDLMPCHPNSSSIQSKGRWGSGLGGVCVTPCLGFIKQCDHSGVQEKGSRRKMLAETQIASPPQLPVLTQFLNSTVALVGCE